MQVLPNKVILRTDGVNVPYVRKARNSDWWWSSCYWLWEMEHSGKAEAIESGADVVEKFKRHEAKILSAMKKKSVVKTDVFDRVFKLPLWEAQKHAASIMSVSPFFCLCDAVGLGKSNSAFAALVLLKELGKIQHACVVCPTSVKFQWATEIERALNNPRDYPVAVVHGTRSERKRAYAQNAFLYVCNYESLRVDVQKRGYPFHCNIDAVIFDEAWKVKNWRSKLQRTMKLLFKDTRYKYALNASPISNGYEELFGIFDVLQPLVFLSWSTFKDSYCRFMTLRLKTGRQFPKLVGYKDIPLLRRKIAPYMLRRTVRDMGWTSPQLTVTPYWVELTPDQRIVYDMLKSAEANPLEKVVHARVACLYTKGTPSDRSPKFFELETILNEVISPTEKVLVFSESKTFLQEILPHFVKTMKALLISGEDNAADRATKVDSFTTGNARVLFCTAAGEAGLNLQAADIVINMDLPWNAERLRQRVGRLRPHQGGEGRHIRVINILATDTIESRIIDRIQEKVGYVSRFFSETQEDLVGVFDPKSLEKEL